MAVTISWKPVANADKIRVYQSPTPFTFADIGTNPAITKVEVPGTDTSKSVAIPRNTVHWFALSAVDADGLELFCEVFPMGNFPNTGPGPDTILRGDWDFGLFGELTTEQLFTNAELGSGIVAAGATVNEVTTGGRITKWFKCIVNGKIIFIPNTFIYFMQAGGDKPTLLAQRKLSMTAGFPGAAILSKNGNDFMYRLPSYTRSVPAGQISSPTRDDILSSEAGMIAALETGSQKIGRNAVGVGNPLYNVWDNLGDMALGSGGDIPLATANYYAQSNNVQWGVHCMIPRDGSYMTYAIQQWFQNSSVSYGNFYVMPILELVF